MRIESRLQNKYWHTDAISYGTRSNSADNQNEKIIGHLDELHMTKGQTKLYLPE